MRGSCARAACLAAALGLTFALAACAGGTAGGSITVLVPWAPLTAEYNAFHTVIEDFQKLHPGITVNADYTRAPTEQLNADLAAGKPLPDLVDLPNPSAVNEFQHHIVPPVGVSLSSYDEPWRSLAESAGTVLAVPVKADIKSLLWYQTADVKHPPSSWAALTTLAKSGTPWCLGLSSDAASGWPGADWIADIVLATEPVQDYQEWINGTLRWNSPQVRTAWNQWGAFLRDGSAVVGGRAAALDDPSGKTPIGNGSKGQCLLEHGALSASGIIVKNVTSYNYVPFPSESAAKSPVMVSGDFMALFTHNPNAEAFLSYLSTTPAQETWVNRPGFAFSADAAVTSGSYPHKVQQSLANLLQPGSGTTLCFTAADMMSTDVSTAFYKAVLDYVNNPGTLKSSLKGLDQTEEAKPSYIAKETCATPGQAAAH